MQVKRGDGEQSQVRIDLDDALDILDSEVDEAIVAAGEALSVLDEDEAAGEIMYVHQLVQEYFAARALAREPAPGPREGRVAGDADLAELWTRRSTPSIRPTRCRRCRAWAGRRPPVLAAAMAEDPASFLRRVMTKTNLALAGRAAAQPELRAALAPGPAERLALGHWSRAAATARPNCATGLPAATPLGDLGDPRFELRVGPHGEYMLPPLWSRSRPAPIPSGPISGSSGP